MRSSCSKDCQQENQQAAANLRIVNCDDDDDDEEDEDDKDDDDDGETLDMHGLPQDTLLVEVGGCWKKSLKH